MCAGGVRDFYAALGIELPGRDGLGWLLCGRDVRIAVSDTPAAVRARLDQVGVEGIFEVDHGAYRVSEIALYSSYQLPAPPPRRPSRH